MIKDIEAWSAANQVRRNAYAPYSGFGVGVALRCRDGRLFTGCNVENASFGLCICAERAAVTAAIAAGCSPGSFMSLTLSTDTREPTLPCGACRQFLLEICGPDLEVLCATVSGKVQFTTMSELLPHAFDGSSWFSANTSQTKQSP